MIRGGGGAHATLSMARFSVEMAGLAVDMRCCVCEYEEALHLDENEEGLAIGSHNSTVCLGLFDTEMGRKSCIFDNTYVCICLISICPERWILDSTPYRVLDAHTHLACIAPVSTWTPGICPALPRPPQDKRRFKEALTPGGRRGRPKTTRHLLHQNMQVP